MKVKELIAQLEMYDGETLVHFAYPAGDYWHTTLAREVQSTEEMLIKYSQYHEQYQLVENEDEEEEEKGQEMVILS
jgi:hypothetical protein